MPGPGDAITWRQAAQILGCSVSTVARLVRAGELSRGPAWAHRQLSRPQVEAVALARYHPRRSAGRDPYWLTSAQAARTLGVSPGRVRQLADAERIPYATTPKGQRLYRCKQLEVVANARPSRRLTAS